MGKLSEKEKGRFAGNAGIITNVPGSYKLYVN